MITYHCRECGAEAQGGTNPDTDVLYCPTHPREPIESIGSNRNWEARRAAVDLLAKFHGEAFSLGRHRGQIDALWAVLEAHPEARLISCADEKTGCRFGQAKCRAGRAAKIGRTTHQRQIWAIWGDAR